MSTNFLKLMSEVKRRMLAQFAANIGTSTVLPNLAKPSKSPKEPGETKELSKFSCQIDGTNLETLAFTKSEARAHFKSQIGGKLPTGLRIERG